MITIIQQIPDFIEFVGRSESVLKHFNDMDMAYINLDDNTTKYNNISLTFDRIEFVNIDFHYNNKTSILNKFNISIDTNNKIIDNNTPKE